jgi:hypothetical protein
MAVWKFQLLPHVPDILSKGYRMDAVGQIVDQQVNDALPYRFHFHKITKLVFILGTGSIQERPYTELDGVAKKVVPSFDLLRYAAATDDQKVAMLRGVVTAELKWFEENFQDAGFVAKARAKLPWAA